MPFTFNTISEADILRSPGGRTMIDAINYSGPKNLILTGCPGSGKTTVAIMRAMRLQKQGRNILLVTYQNLLKVNLANMCGRPMWGRISGFYDWYVKNANSLIKNNDSTKCLLDRIEHLNNYDEILLDEGQDLEERFLMTLIGKANKISIGADSAQKIHEHGQTAAEIISILENVHEPHRINLQYNYRNNFETYDFGRHFLPHNERANHRMTLDKITKGILTKPIIFETKNKEDIIKILNVRLNEAGDVNVAILLYHIEEVEEYYNIIQTLGFKCSKYYHELPKEQKRKIENSLESIIVTTYKAAKGLEFQVVIMPNIETAMDEDFKTEEHYYVGCTRAKEQLFLIYSGEKPKFLNSFPETSYKLVSDVSNDEQENDDLPF